MSTDTGHSKELPAPGSTERTTIKRIAEKAVHDREVMNGILDAGLVAHVSVADATASHTLFPSPTHATATTCCFTDPPAVACSAASPTGNPPA